MLRNTIQGSLKRLLNRHTQDASSGNLFSRSIVLYGLKIVGAGLAFGYSVALARLLGVAEYGLYAYVLAWLQVLIFIALFGQDQLLVRNLSAYEARSEWSLLNGQLRWSRRLVVYTAVTLTIIAGSLVWLIAGNDRYFVAAFWAGCLFLPLTSLSLMRQGALRGLHRVILGQALEIALRPLCAILLLGIVAYVLRDQLNSIWALTSYAMATLIVFIVGTILLERHIPAAARQTTPQYTGRTWLLSAVPLAYIGVSSILNNRVGVLMLGTLQSEAAAGIYQAVNRGADLIVMTVGSINAVLAPTFSRLYAQNDIPALQKTAVQGARLATLIAFPLMLGLVVFGSWFLAIYGPGFTAGHTALAMLSIGQLINAMTGSVGQLLIMSQHARSAAWVMTLSNGVNILLCLVLIPSLSITGAALAATVSLVFWNLLLVYLVYQRLGIVVTVFGGIRRKAG